MNDYNSAIENFLKNNGHEDIETTVKILNTFTPRLISSYIAGSIGESKLKASLAPIVRIKVGAILLVDISGFTRLSGFWSSKGPEGIDYLQNIINGFLTSLVDTILLYNGDILNFAGDALICLFTDDDVRNSCVLAMTCAMKLKDICNDTLTVHIGISLGDINMAFIGGYENRWEHLVSGLLLKELSSCLDNAVSKAVVVTKSFFDTIKPIENVDIKEFAVATNNYRIDYFSVPSAMLSLKSSSEYITDVDSLQASISLIPYPVTSNILANTFTAIIGELREVTTIFVKWDSFDYEEHRDYKLIQKLFVSMQKTIAEASGFLRQFLVDDKGMVSIISFGVPTASFHNNAYRAVRTAVEISNIFEKSKMQVSFGITTGTAYCGIIGAISRREYTIIGDCINLSARFMGKACYNRLHNPMNEKSGNCKIPSYIYIDTTTHQQLSNKTQSLFKKLENPLVLKGKEKPVDAYIYASDEFLPMIEDTEVVDIASNVSKMISDKESNSSKQTEWKYILGKGFLSISQPNSYGSLNETVRKLVTKAPSGQSKSIVVRVNDQSIAEEVIQWILSKNGKSDFQVVHVKLGSMNRSKNYSSLSLLFREIIGRENYDDVQRQMFVVSSLLSQAYKNDKGTIENVAYHAMRIAFGISCPLRVKQSKKGDLSFNLSKNFGQSSSSTLPEIPKLRNIPATLILQCVVDIFMVLLQSSNVLVFENIDRADNLSFKLILEISNIPSRTLFVYTKLSKNLVSPSPKYQEQLNLPLMQLLRRDSTTTISVSAYTLEDTKSAALLILSKDVQKESIGDDLFVNIFQLSGGSPFWIKEICSYINYYGVDDFMSNTGEQNTSFLANVASTLVNNNGKLSFGPNDTSTLRVDGRNLSHFVTARFSKLGVKEQYILKYASICGHLFNTDILLGLLQYHGGIGSQITIDDLGIILNYLVDSNWLHTVDVEIKNDLILNYRFNHGAIQKIIYSLTPLTVRKQMHKFIAESVESYDYLNIINDNINEHVVRSSYDISLSECPYHIHCQFLAHHYYKCGTDSEKSKAFKYLSFNVVRYAIHKDADIDDFFDEIKLAAEVCPSEMYFKTLMGMGIKAISRIRWECDKSLKSQNSFTSLYSKIIGYFSSFISISTSKVTEAKPNLEEVVLCLNDLMHKLRVVHHFNYNDTVNSSIQIETEGMEPWQKYLHSESKLLAFPQRGKSHIRTIPVILNSFLKSSRRIVVSNAET